MLVSLEKLCLKMHTERVKTLEENKEWVKNDGKSEEESDAEDSSGEDDS